MNTLVLDERLHVQEHLTWVEVSENALVRNLEQIKKLTLPSAEILGVVKANAYGHGLLEIAKVLEKKVAYFGVASIDEALQLRQCDIETPVLLFGVHLKEEVKEAVKSNIALSVSGLDHARLIDSIGSELRRHAAVHIKVDTGMGRLGIPISEANQTISKIHEMPYLKLEGIYTHFPIAEQTEKDFSARQLSRFQSLLVYLGTKGIHFAYRHAANSAGTINYKEAHLNLIRPGLAMYGIYPDAQLEAKIALEPVLSWKARVILVKELKAGETAGYGRTFVAEKKTKIAILPVGYSHGYPFALSGKGKVILHGKIYPLAGRVSMDYTAVHIGDDPVQSGDVATLLGSEGSASIKAEEIAGWVNTIPYEIVTRIQPHIPRIKTTRDTV